MAEMIEIDRPDGETAPGYFLQAAQNAPGVVVIQEWWGVTDHMKEIAARLQFAGFNAIVPDLYRGRKAAVGDEANHLVQGLDFQDASSQDVRGALQFLKRNGGKAATLGFCIGGALALLTAMHVGETDAAVSFYGAPPPEAGDLSIIKVPVQVHAAAEDEFYTPERMREVEAQIKKAGSHNEFYWYEGAQHGFVNPNPPGQAGLGHYNKEAATLAWNRAVDFLTRTLNRR